LADLGLLGKGDISSQKTHLFALSTVPQELGQLDGLRMMNGHVPSETRFSGVVGGHPVGEEEPQRQADYGESQKDNKSSFTLANNSQYTTFPSLSSR
jgi:hypothetical protein